MKKYGKPSAHLLTHKRSFFEENDSKRDMLKQQAEVYSKQPARINCKNCDQALPDQALFTKHGVSYCLCERCGHLNGMNQDTVEFCSSIYIEDDGQSYGAVYRPENKSAFTKRVEDIYKPKASFLVEALAELGATPADLRCTDMGAGSGYFVQALLDQGVHQVQGFEVSRYQVEIANAMIGQDRVTLHSLDATPDIVRTVDANVLSLIGVLEHLQDPRSLLQAAQENPTIRYIFISVPLFSPCVFIETIFDEVMPRQLAGGHTHLYTESSINWLCSEFGLNRRAEWWFGTDMFDFFRSVYVMLNKISNNQLADVWHGMYSKIVDHMQRVIDEHHLSSEVHLLLEKTS